MCFFNCMLTLKKCYLRTVSEGKRWFSLQGRTCHVSNFGSFSVRWWSWHQADYLTGLMQGSVVITRIRNCQPESAQPSTVLNVTYGIGWRWCAWILEQVTWDSTLVLSLFTCVAQGNSNTVCLAFLSCKVITPMKTWRLTWRQCHTSRYVVYASLR